MQTKIFNLTKGYKNYTYRLEEVGSLIARIVKNIGINSNKTTDYWLMELLDTGYIEQLISKVRHTYNTQLIEEYAIKNLANHTKNNSSIIITYIPNWKELSDYIQTEEEIDKLELKSTVILRLLGHYDLTKNQVLKMIKELKLLDYIDSNYSSSLDKDDILNKSKIKYYINAILNN